MLRLMNKTPPQAVVKPMKLFPKSCWSLQKKPAPALWVGIVGQPSEILKGSMFAQERCRFEAVQASKDGLHEGQEHWR